MLKINTENFKILKKFLNAVNYDNITESKVLLDKQI